MDGIENAHLKLGWAQKHLSSLQFLIEGFVHTKPCTFIREDNVENQWSVLRIKLPDVPDCISLTAGDIVHNMRSSLDHLVWSLANRPGGHFHKTAFPIIETNNKGERDRFDSQTEGVTPPEAVTEIDALQPYHRGASYQAHPLWRLHRMDIIDKHRRIPTQGTDLVVKFLNVDTRAEISNYIQSLDDCFVIKVPVSEKSKLELNPTCFFKVNFGGDDTGFTEDLDGIWEIYHFIANDVLPRFMRFFP